MEKIIDHLLLESRGQRGKNITYYKKKPFGGERYDHCLEMGTNFTGKYTYKKLINNRF